MSIRIPLTNRRLSVPKLSMYVRLSKVVAFVAMDSSIKSATNGYRNIRELLRRC